MAVTERTLSYDHMWSPAHPPAVKGARPPRAMATRGFEVKHLTYGNQSVPVVHTPSGLPFAPLEVYDGPLPTHDAKLARYMQAARWAQRADYRSAFWGHFAYLRKAGFDHDLAFAMQHHAAPAETKALSEAVGPSGGYWVPADFLAEILSAISEQSLLSMATLRPTTSDTLYVPRFLPSLSAPSVRSTRLEPTVTGETSNQTPVTDTQFGLLPVAVRVLRSKVRLSRDLLADAEWAMPFLKDAFARDLGAQITAQMLAGPDFGALLYEPAIPVTNLQPGAGDTLSTTSEAQWRALKSSLPGQYRNNAVVIMGTDLLAAWENQAPGPSGRPAVVRRDDYHAVYVFDEVPLVSSGSMPSYGTPGPRMIYGDVQAGYLIANRADVTMQIITESVAADYDEVDIVLRARLGGIVQNVDAFRIGTL